MTRFDAALLLLRAVFGLFFAYHGYNKVFGKGGLSGTARWFASIGMKWPTWQARIAATTEIGSGVMLAVGFLTPLAAAGIIGVMVVAIWVEHRKVGFFVFLPNQGWEYCASIAVAVLGIATLGPGEWSIDHAIGWDWQSWAGTVIALAAGVGGAVLQLAVSYRPAPKPVAEPA